MMRTGIEVRRASNVIAVCVMVIMFGLTANVMGMVMTMTASPKEINLIPLSLCVAAPKTQVVTLG